MWRRCLRCLSGTMVLELESIMVLEFLLPGGPGCCRKMRVSASCHRGAPSWSHLLQLILEFLPSLVLLHLLLLILVVVLAVVKSLETLDLRILTTAVAKSLEPLNLRILTTTVLAQTWCSRHP